jgi:aspartate kinase
MDGENISRAISALINEAGKGSRIAVVVSAMGETTDQLLSAAKKALGNEASYREIDEILSMGERTSARIVAAALTANGVKSRYFDPANEDWPIITDESFGNATPILDACEERIRKYVLPLLEQNVIPVIPGFIGKTINGEITTIGRGGSDATAFILAKYLGAKEVILVTNVEGIMTADPKLVGSSKRLAEIDVDTLAGLADSGTKFIHKKALKYKDEKIDVKVISHTHGRLDVEGTVIKGAFPAELTAELASSNPVCSITIVGKSVLGEPRIIQEIAEELKSKEAPLLGLSASYDSLIAYVPEQCSRNMLESIHSIVTSHKETIAMAVRQSLALLRVRGFGLEETPGVIGKISEPLRLNGINIFGIFTIASSILVFVSWNDREKALELIRESLKVK